MTQNRLINNVKQLFRQLKNKFNRLIEGILIRYDNYVYYKQLERFYKNKRSVLEKLKDKVNLAIACLSKYISKYNVSGTLDGHPHRLFIDGVKSGLLRRKERNRVK